MSELLEALLAKSWGSPGRGQTPGLQPPTRNQGSQRWWKQKRQRDSRRWEGGRLHNRRISQSPDFKLFLKISEDLAAPSLHVPMATPAGAVPLPADWTALRSPLTVAHTQAARRPSPARDRGSRPALPKALGGQKAMGDMGTVASVPSACSRSVRLRSYGSWPLCEVPTHVSPLAVLGSGGQRAPKLTSPSRQEKPSQCEPQGAPLPAGLHCVSSHSRVQLQLPAPSLRPCVPFVPGWHLRWHLRPASLQHDGWAVTGWAWTLSRGHRQPPGPARPPQALPACDPGTKRPPLSPRLPQGWPSVKNCAGTVFRALCTLSKTPTIRPLAWLSG